MTKWLGVFAMMIGVLGFSACNTMQGFGKDVEKLGDKIEKSAERNK